VRVINVRARSGARVDAPMLRDMILGLTNLNNTYQISVRVPEGVYTDSSTDRRDDAKARLFASWCARGAIDDAELARLAGPADEGREASRPLVCAVSLCREAHTIRDAPDISMAVVALFDAATAGALLDRRE
jgi:hypothetical protein